MTSKINCVLVLYCENKNKRRGVKNTALIQEIRRVPLILYLIYLAIITEC